MISCLINLHSSNINRESREQTEKMIVGTLEVMRAPETQHPVWQRSNWTSIQRTTIWRRLLLLKTERPQKWIKQVTLKSPKNS
jgi:hypothetical protein